MISARNKFPFTPNQWQELEHQALIFKYMVSGVPIPPQLIYSVKTSFDSSLAPNPDSKYCERHMHRGRNRSRKPVEVNASSASTSTTAGSSLSTAFPSINSNLSIPSSNTTSSFSFSPLTSETYTHFDPFLYSHSSTSTRFPGLGSSVPSHQFLDSATGIDYRHLHGTREGERTFFPEASGSVRVVPYSYQPLTMVQSFGQQQEHQHPQCFVLGTDIKSAKPIKLEKDGETQKPVHQFLGGWTPRNNNNNNGSWLDLASNSRVQSGKNISVPTHHFCFVFFFPHFVHIYLSIS